jgi:hypothetical protein
LPGVRAETVDRVFLVSAALIAALAAVSGDVVVVATMALVAMGTQARAWARRRYPERYNERGWPVARARGRGGPAG